MAPSIICSRIHQRYHVKIRQLIMSTYCKPKFSTHSETTMQPALNFEDDYNKSHIQTSHLQKILLSAGSAAISLLNPARADTIAIFGEASGETALACIHEKMMSSEEGRRILQDKPRINSKTIDIDALRQLAPGTLGHAYTTFLDDNQVTPDSRVMVQFVDDMEHAYVMQRYREVHDLIHTVLGMRTNMLGEVAVKWVEGLQTKLPMCIGGAIFGPLRFAPKQRLKYTKYYLPWAIHTGREAQFLLSVYWEKRWEQSMSDLHKELNIEPFMEPKS